MNIFKCNIYLSKGVFMEFQTIILRFRDLVTEEDETIVKHKSIIEQNGYVWWAWWKKGNEKLPVDDFSAFSTYAKSKSIDVYLMDSGQAKLYKASCRDICLSADAEMDSPEPQKTPEYYRNRKYPAWFKFSSIDECDPNELQKHTYVEVDNLFVENSTNYQKFHEKKIHDINELIQQNRTVWFVRDYKETDRDYEIVLLNANILEPKDFSTQYFETGGTSMLWLSDLHFGSSVFPINQQDDANAVTLTAHIKSAWPDASNMSGLIITGDITSIGQNEGFCIAKEFIADLNRNLTRPLSSENIIFCPGNHDFVRKEELIESRKPENISENPENFEGFRDFYHSIHNLNPNKYLVCGKKILMSSGRVIEFVALNSLILQQYKDFEGHGFLSQEQLDFAADEMGWKEDSDSTSIRIVMMHHHYLPTCLAESVDATRASSVVYDAERLIQWLQKHNIRMLLHGHKHQSFTARICRNLDSENAKDIYVIGMGSTGAKNCENKFATIHFNIEDITINLYRIYHDNIELDKRVQKIVIPI